MTDRLNAILDEMAGMHPLPKVRPGIEEVVTPSGIEVRYTDAKHTYHVRPDPIGSSAPEEEWRPVPSVSTILRVLDKPALPWWGMKIGVEGLLTLLRDETIDAHWHLASVDDVVRTLTERKLTVKHVRDKAGERGVTVHDALEAWAATGSKPDPKVYPEEQRGYVQGLLAFLDDARIEPEATECIVGSLEHGYAGRYDLRGHLGVCDLRRYADKKDAAKDRFSEPPTAPYLIDLKTSSGVYLEHFLQLEAYEGASVECGYAATQERAVLRVLADGRYEFRLSPATHADFLAVLATHNALAALKERAA